MGPVGYQEMVFIFILALLLFGPKKLPELGRTLGKAITEFRRASNELKATFDREMKSLEQETQLTDTQSTYSSDTYNYDYSSYETYDGSYGEDGNESPAATESTESASAPEGAESPSAAAPEGTVAYGTETAAAHHEPDGHPTNGAAPAGHAAPESTTAEQKA